MRITGQLIDAETGSHLWADRFDGSIEDVFELQDKVASSVAGVIEPTLQVAETARSVGRATNDLTAYDLYLRAYAMVFSSGARFADALKAFFRGGGMWRRGAPWIKPSHKSTREYLRKASRREDARRSRCAVFRSA